LGVFPRSGRTETPDGRTFANPAQCE
jgi:hypothetical protein